MGLFSRFSSSHKSSPAAEVQVAARAAVDSPAVGSGTPALKQTTKLAVPPASQIASAPSAPLEKPAEAPLPAGWIERKDAK